MDFPYFKNHTTNEKTFYPDLSKQFYNWDPSEQIKYVQKVINQNNWNKSDIITFGDITCFQNNNIIISPKKYYETTCYCPQCKK